MGTRSLTQVVLDEAVRIAQYGQYDGYPSSMGLIVLEFARERLSTVPGRDSMMERLFRCRFAPEFDDDISLGAKRLQGIWDETANSDASVILYDGRYLLGVAWTYTIDLDAGTLEAVFEYEPLRKKSWSLDVLPTDEQFLEALEDNG